MSIDTEYNRRFHAHRRRGFGVADLFVLAAVPVALWLVYLLPEATRRSLAFEYWDPTPLTAFASAYVHLDAGHLLANVGAYAVVVAVVFALSVASGRRRRFYTVFATFLVVFPLALSYLNLTVPRHAVAFGFSGVVMAFAGYLPLALADYLHVRFDVGPGTALAPVFFFCSLAVVAALSVRTVVPGDATVLLGTSGLVVVAVLSALLFAVAAYDESRRFRAKLQAAVHATGHFELGVAGFVLLALFPFVAFPADPTVGGHTLNLYVHLLGYALGFTVTYATAVTAARLTPAEAPPDRSTGDHGEWLDRTVAD